MQKTAFVDQLENRRMLAVSPVHAGKTGVNLVLADDGSKENSNVIIVNFTGDVNLIDSGEIRVIGYAVNPKSVNLAQVKKTIGVKSVVVNPSNKSISITTDRMVRKGARIFINEGALRDNNGDDIVHGNSVGAKITTKKGLNKERFTLACRAFVPTDFDFFSSARYEQGVEAEVANGVQTASSVRSGLADFLTKKVTAGTITSAKRTEMLAEFDSSDNEAIVPDAVLRAAICSLAGTMAERAITSYFDGDNATGQTPTVIKFDGDLFSESARFAETRLLSNGRLRIIFNPDLQGESFVALSAILAGEAVIADNDNGVYEEVIANGFIEPTVWAQQITTNVSFARKKTVLSTRNNYNLLALLNSGDRQFPRIGVRNAPLANGEQSVVAGSTPEFGDQPITSVADLIQSEMGERGIPTQSTPGNIVADALLNVITGKTYTLQTFSDGLVSDVDVSQGVMGDKFAIKVAQTMKLALS